MKKIFLKNEDSTIKLGQKIAKLLFEGAILCLNGDLGAGKTCMTRSIAHSLGIEEDITSPTFTIINEYEEGRLKLYHFDVYRIGESVEMYDIGFEDYINSNGVCIIEWSNIIEDILPKERLELYISYCEEGREVEFKAYGLKYEKLVEELLKNENIELR
ncbi:tRNA (adenosine(37)-N6)-threonylcarbamoyltransferase complex ATPase subunit type 1 TsaE [Peptostreptococcus equinus]|uniref:tRNA threonylcarbamoyladenosine biosynthesis protein TsaE n=1 Tax=Peptostreptococcus equinus TaxID=3003601 RepID=A0ABY7JMR6_9FIRM|nr:tRNA (adenosine(37)-N6)-threonylcarbamoyltransferase complex ATPase subunit type 1 TsaE [Peptostreptococcus sp. CBA3647]WAW14666.1 tRNA (adenosine(37)-N6)-threonylcarbamoyltransferase complex ATPase subunit type 1 TsaE [Peptostreptococcus sp. CBA3647]